MHLKTLYGFLNDVNRKMSRTSDPRKLETLNILWKTGFYMLPDQGTLPKIRQQ